MTDLVFEPDVVVSEQALERSKKFKKIKLEQGLDAVMFDSVYPDTRVFFNDQGEVTCISRDSNFQPPEDWKTHDFTEEEIGMVSGVTGLSRFSVIKTAEGYKITADSVREPLGIIQGNTLEPIDKNIENPDITVTVTHTDIEVTATQEIIAQLVKNNYSYDGNKVLAFYVTLRGNPHFMVYNFYVPLGDLANKGIVKIPVDDDFTEYSIYTKPVFDSYGRV